MSTPRFQELTIKRINTEGGGSVAVTLDIPPALREIYRFEPGQFLTLRATVNGEEVRALRRFCRFWRPLWKSSQSPNLRWCWATAACLA